MSGDWGSVGAQSGWGGVSGLPIFEEDRMKASWLPVIVGSALLPLSLALLFLASQQMETSSSTRLAFSLAGYILTPLVTSGCLVWAMKSHRAKVQAENYSAASGNRVIGAAGVIAGLGFLLAIPQILLVSNAIAVMLGGGA